MVPKGCAGVSSEEFNNNTKERVKNEIKAGKLTGKFCVIP